MFDWNKPSRRVGDKVTVKSFSLVVSDAQRYPYEVVFTNNERYRYAANGKYYEGYDGGDDPRDLENYTPEHQPVDWSKPLRRKYDKTPVKSFCRTGFDQSWPYEVVFPNGEEETYSEDGLLAFSESNPYNLENYILEVEMLDWNKTMTVDGKEVPAIETSGGVKVKSFAKRDDGLYGVLLENGYIYACKEDGKVCGATSLGDLRNIKQKKKLAIVVFSCGVNGVFSHCSTDLTEEAIIVRHVGEKVLYRDTVEVEG